MNAGNPIDALWAVVLAAGESRRLGRTKQLVRWRGETLIERSVRGAQAVCERRVLVVLGAHRETIEPALAALAPTIVLNTDWAEGLASSLRAGVRALPPSCAAALLIACDQPRVSAAALQALAQCWSEETRCAVASEYAGTCGIPAIVPARLFAALTSLTGDRGARAVLLAEGERLRRVPLPEAALDVDDEAALRALDQDSEQTTPRHYPF